MGNSEITNVMLLRLFRQCSHLQRGSGRFHGQGRILALLLTNGRMTQREITENLQRRSATLSEQLEIMEKSGLITREKNADDKRNIDIRLTEEGKQTALEARKEFAETADILFSGLDEAEKSSLCATLRKLSAAWLDFHADRPADEDTACV